MDPPAPAGAPGPSGDSGASQQQEQPDPSGDSGTSTVPLRSQDSSAANDKGKKSWVKRSAASVSRVTGRVASATVKAPAKYVKRSFSSKDRSTVNPISLAATKAQAQTRLFLKEGEKVMPEVVNRRSHALAGAAARGLASLLQRDHPMYHPVALEGRCQTVVCVGRAAPAAI